MFCAEKCQQETAKQTQGTQRDDQGRKAKKRDQRRIEAAQNRPDHGGDNEDQPERGMRIDQHEQFDGPVHRKSRNGREGNIDTARQKRCVNSEGKQSGCDAVPDQVEEIRRAEKHRIDQRDPDRQ